MVQINQQADFGGGEVYTAFLCRSLDRLGIPTLLLHHPAAAYWPHLGLPTSTELRATPPDDLLRALPTDSHWVVTHGPMRAMTAEAIAAKHLLTAIAHMPPQGRAGDCYAHCHWVFGVSGYVVQGLRSIGVPTWEEPLYGAADFRRAPVSSVLRETSCYQWDQRKGRDRILGWFEPWLEPLRRRPLFMPCTGITLGVVSRLTPIKQFPKLFEIVAPIIARREGIRLEIFGAGGYASVRDLKRATRCLGDRVHFWGHQHDVAAVYNELDYLLTGLPEKEALGLNVIEAQACGLPVLAVNAPPFTETVLPGKTGLLYTDPRRDRGANFAAVLDDLIRSPLCIPDEIAVREHLACFSEEAFTRRIAKAAARIGVEMRGAATGHE